MLPSRANNAGNAFESILTSSSRLKGFYFHFFPMHNPAAMRFYTLPFAQHIYSTPIVG